MKGKDFAIGAVVGGFIGALTALLLAPKSGRELREDISDQYERISEKTGQIAGDVSQKTQTIAKTVSTHTSEWVDKAKTTVNNVAEEVKAWKLSRTQTEKTDGMEQNAAATLEIVETSEK